MKIKIKKYLKNKVRPYLLDKNKYFIYGIVFFVLIASILKLHGSSIGIYHQIFNGGKDESLIYATPRGIRSDEWMVSSNLTSSQNFNDYNNFNGFIGDGQELSVIYDAPTNHWSTLFKPNNWGFLFSNFETGFSYKWWFMAGSLMIAAYLVLMQFTNRKILLSALGSIILYLSPFVHWWYITIVIQSIAFSLFLLYFIIRLIKYENIKDLVIAVIGIAYFLIALIFLFYPPFVISLGWGILALSIGFLLKHRRNLTKNRLKIMTIAGIISGALVAVIFILFYKEFKDVIGLIMNTSYPGRRELPGGGYSLYHLLFSFLNPYLKNDAVLNSYLNNQSEASNFYYFYLISLPLILIGHIFLIIKKKVKVDTMLIASTLYFLFIFTWMFIGLPLVLGKLTLLTMIPNNRMLIGVGTVNIIMMIYFISNIKVPKSKVFNIIAILFSLIISIGIFYFGTRVKIGIDGLINNTYSLIFFCIIFFGIFISMLMKRRYIALVLLLILSLVSVVQVNPVYRGVTALNDSKLSQELAQIDGARDSRWVTFGSILISNYLAGNGYHTLSGVNLYPQFKTWQSLDPNNEYYIHYNRYAHTDFYSTEDLTHIEFLNPTSDTLRVVINPCNKFFSEQRVNFFISTGLLDEFKCLEKVRTLELARTTLTVYRNLNFK